MDTTKKIIIRVICIMVAFYFIVMLAWNFSNKNHKPSSLFWDMRKEGFQEDPLHDRKRVE